MIFVGNDANSKNIQDLIVELDPSSIIVLMDSNTEAHCEPLLTPMLPFSYHKIVIETGEKVKSWDTIMRVTDKFYELHTDRHALLISLGGGVVTDIGGMVASIYHRGISCIHIPTTLLGMCDAAIGGKNGINLHGTKNQIGTYYLPAGIFIQTTFLQTLPEREIRNGQVELLKTLFLMRNPPSDLDAMQSDWERYVGEAARFKQGLIHEDLHDLDKRRFLNIGHTVGHALESYYHESNEDILHGEAVLLGLYYEHLMVDEKLNASYFEKIIRSDYPELLSLVPPVLSQLTNLLQYDKKNRSQTVELPYVSDVHAWKKEQVSVSELSKHVLQSWLK